MDNHSAVRARARAALDGRIAISATAFALAFAFAALLDRAGAPEHLVAAMAPAFTLLALAGLGFLLHSMQVSFYYAAGRAVPPEWAGFANAAIIGALAAPMAPALAGQSWTNGAPLGLLAGAGFALLGLTPLLRKAGVFSLAGFLAARFPAQGPRLGVIAATAAASALIALAGQCAASQVLVDLGAGRVFAAFTAAAATLLIAGPGGLSGVVWVGAAAAGVALLGLGWPALSFSLAPGSGFSFLDAADWRGAARLIEALRLFHPQSFDVDITIAGGLALGVATLAPVLAPAAALEDSGRARIMGLPGFAWTIALILLVAAGAAAGAVALAGSSIGEAPERLPTAIYASSASGAVVICGEITPTPQAARKACIAAGLSPGAPLRPQDVRVRGDLLAHLPAFAGMSAAVGGMVAAARLALALSLAAAGLHACATALGHEALFHLRGGADLTSRRLALARTTLVAVAAVGAALSARGAADAATLAAAAMATSAAIVAPVTFLAFWRRAGNRDAILALGAGAASLFLFVWVDGEATQQSLALASLAAAIIGLSLGAVSTLAATRPRPPGAAFLRRLLKGDGSVSAPDKGA